MIIVLLYGYFRIWSCIPNQFLFSSLYLIRFSQVVFSIHFVSSESVKNQFAIFVGMVFLSFDLCECSECSKIQHGSIDILSECEYRFQLSQLVLVYKREKDTHFDELIQRHLQFYTFHTSTDMTSGILSTSSPLGHYTYYPFRLLLVVFIVAVFAV